MLSLQDKYGPVMFIKEAAEELRVGEDDIMELIGSGTLYALSFGAGNYRIPVDALDNLLSGNGGTGIHEQRSLMKCLESMAQSLEQIAKQSYTAKNADIITFFCVDAGDKEAGEMAKLGYGQGSCYYSEVRQRFECQFSIPDGDKVKRKLVWGDTEADAIGKMAVAKQLAAGLLVNTIPANVTPVIQAPASVIQAPVSTEPDPSDLLFAEHILDYTERLVASGSARANKDKARLLGVIEEKLGHLRLGKLDRKNLQKFLNEFAAKPYAVDKAGNNKYYSSSYIGKMYDNLNCCIRDAREQELLIGNPMELVKEPESKQAYTDEVPKDLTDEEMRMILAALEKKPMLLALVLVMLYTGCRLGEIFALKYLDFNFKDKTVSIKRTLSFDVVIDPKTKKSSDSKPLIKELKNERKGKRNYVARRVLKVNDAVLNAIQSLWDSIHADADQVAKREANGWHEYLFTAPTDGELKLPDYYLAEYGKELRRHGVDSSQYNMYRFRHTFSTRLLRDHKLAPKTVARTMGDSSIDMVMIKYHSVNKDDMLNASGAYAEAMSASIGSAEG